MSEDRIKNRMNSGHGAGCLLLIILMAAVVFSSVALYGALTGPSATISDTSGTLALQGRPGQSLRFALTGASVDGSWALPDGLTLALQNGTSSQVAAPVAQGWGSSIDCGPNGDECNGTGMGFAVRAQFTIPSSDSPGTTLTGDLTGSIAYPQPAGSGTFQNATDTVNAYVTIRVTATGAQDEEFGLSWTAWLAVLAGTLAALAAYFLAPVIIRKK